MDVAVATVGGPKAQASVEWHSDAVATISQPSVAIATVEKP